MSTIVDLPNGEKATLKDSSELTNKEVKKLQKAQFVAGGTALRLQEDYGFDQANPDTWVQAAHMTDDEADNVDLYQRRAVLLRLESWTIDRPLPETEDDVDDLPTSIYAPLTIAASDIKFPEFEVSPDPKAPTANSGASSSRSKARN